MRANKTYLKDNVCVSVYPLEVMNITQGMNEGYSHKGRLTIDDGGKDGGIDNVYAPFDLTIKWKQTTGDKTGILACSNGKVITPKGLQYVNIILWHDNDTSDLWVDKEIKQGQAFYQEGTAGRATGNHVHYGTSFGYYRGGYPLIQNEFGNWEIKNEVSPVDVFYVNDTTIKDGNGYKWQTIELDDQPIKQILAIDGIWGTTTQKAFQKYLGTLQDGYISSQYKTKYNRYISVIMGGVGGSYFVKTLQKHLGVKIDGYLGYETIIALQRKLGVKADGYIGRNTVKALQTALNQGSL